MLTFSGSARSSAVSVTTSPIPATWEPSSTSGTEHLAPSHALLDTDWIPDVAARGWLIVTRDSMIIQNRNEIAAIRENNAKMVALNQRDAQTKWVSSKCS